MAEKQPKQSAFVLFSSRQRIEIESRARDLIAAHGDAAYYVARDMARGGRRCGTAKDPFWSRIASRIARQTGRQIGLPTADRYSHSK